MIRFSCPCTYCRDRTHFPERAEFLNYIFSDRLAIRPVPFSPSNLQKAGVGTEEMGEECGIADARTVLLRRTRF